jgi:hypothetical protein
MLWHGMDHFDNTGEPMPVHGSTEEMLEFFDISPTEQNQFVFNQRPSMSPSFAAIMEHNI